MNKYVNKFIPNAHTPIKRKRFRANHAALPAKEFRETVMKKAKLRKAYLKKQLKQLKQLTIINKTFV